MHKVVNYGSALQAWATQEVIRRLGYDVLIIDYVYPNAFHIKDKKRNIARSVLQWCLHFCQGFPWEKKRKHFEKFWNDNFNLTQTYPCVESYITIHQILMFMWLEVTKYGILHA